MQHKIGCCVSVSTDEQAMKIEGSLDSQKYRLTGFVDLKNMQSKDWGKVVECYIDDGYTADNSKRPAFKRLLQDIKTDKINTILVTDVSRLSRNIRDFCVMTDLFKETKTTFLSLKEQFDTSTAAGEMMLFSLINLAQFERRLISERVSTNFHARAMRGLRNGGRVPLGFRLEAANKSLLYVNEDEVEYVKKVFNTYIMEGSLYRAAAKLRELNIPFKSNNPHWTCTLLGSHLRNYSYAGLREVNKGNKNKKQTDLLPHEKHLVVKAAWPAIIDETTFFTVQDMLNSGLKEERRRLTKSEDRVYLLSNYSACAECGRSLVGLTAHGRKDKFRYYAHRPLEGKKVTCTVKYFNADQVEDIVVNHILHVLEREGHLAGLMTTLNDAISSEKNLLVHQRNEYEKKIIQLDSDIKNLIRRQIQIEDQEMLELYTEQLKEMKTERQTFKRQLEVVTMELNESPNPNAMKEVVETNLKNLKRAWAKSSKSLKKKLLRSVIKRLVIHHDSIDIYYQSYNVDAVAETIVIESQSMGSKPVDLASFRLRQKNKMIVSSHNEKVAGSFIDVIGCGNRI